MDAASVPRPASRFKRIRNGALVSATAWAVRLILTTCRYQVSGWRGLPVEAGEPGIYLLWHNTIMISLGHEGRRGLTALISPGADGEFAARAVQQFGVHAIRGSTSKRSLSLLRRLVRRAETETLRLAVTPDGPRGPRYQVHAGAVWIASRLGIPLRPVGMAAARSWRLRSWDRFRIPKPFTRVSMRYGAPMPVASALDRQGIEDARRRIEAALLDVAGRAHADVGVSWPD